jgi:hypothetical protein
MSLKRSKAVGKVNQMLNLLASAATSAKVCWNAGEETTHAEG